MICTIRKNVAATILRMMPTSSPREWQQAAKSDGIWEVRRHARAGAETWPTRTILEIQTSTDGKSAGPLRVRETSEVAGVDVQVEKEGVVLRVTIRVVTEIRMVQNIDRIHPDFELFAFRNSHALDHVHV